MCGAWHTEIGHTAATRDHAVVWAAPRPKALEASSPKVADCCRPATKAHTRPTRPHPTPHPPHLVLCGHVIQSHQVILSEHRHAVPHRLKIVQHGAADAKLLLNLGCREGKGEGGQAGG